jgi:hypothetical protein
MWSADHRHEGGGLVATTTTKKTDPAEGEIVRHVGGDAAGYIAYDVPESAEGAFLTFPRPFTDNRPDQGDVLVVVATNPEAAKVPFYVCVDKDPADNFSLHLLGAVPAGTYGYAYHLRPVG